MSSWNSRVFSRCFIFPKYLHSNKNVCLEGLLLYFHIIWYNCGGVGLKKKQNTKGWPIFKPVLQISEKDVLIDTANSSVKNFSQSDERYASAVFTISFFISLEHFSESRYFLLLIQYWSLIVGLNVMPFCLFLSCQIIWSRICLFIARICNDKSFRM